MLPVGARLPRMDDDEVERLTEHMIRVVFAAEVQHTINQLPTVLRDAMGVGAAKDQLGHASEVTTNAHYVMLAHEGPSGQAVLESLFTNGER